MNHFQLLSPSDRVFFALDREICAAGLRGNFVEAVFEFDGLPDPALLEKRVDAFVERFPILRSRLQRTRHGYGWVAVEHSRPNFFFHAYSTKGASEIDYTCPWNFITKTHESSADINPVEFHLIELEHGSLFVLHGYHPIIDGKGFEQLVHILFHEDEWDSAQLAEANTEPIANVIADGFSLPAKLRALVKGSLHFMRGGTSALPPSNSGTCNGEIASKRIRYSREETARMVMAARTITTPESGGSGPLRKSGQFAYFVGCTIRALQQAGMGKSGESYNLGYMSTLRTAGNRHPVLGNQVSFLWTGAPVDAVHDRRKLIAGLANKHVRGMEQEIDKTVVAALSWSQFLTPEFLGRLIQRGLGRANRHSFWFGYTGPFSSPMTEMENVPILGFYVIVPPTVPPSVVFSYTMFQQCMTVSITYIPDLIDQAWIEDVIEKLNAELQLGDTANP